jgi:Ca2+-binding RTX toxin-like protein
MDHSHSGLDRETFTGTPEDNVIHGDGGEDWILGWGGDDLLTAEHASGQSGLWGNGGNDTLIGAVPGYGQIHMSGAEGDDRLVLDVTNEMGLQGHHAYGGKGADTFEFINVDAAEVPILGRIDDFDASQDSLWIEGNEIDLFDLPDGVDVVEYQEQFWLKIGDNILYALEGARDGGAERHFSAWPEDINELKVVEFLDNVNQVPFELFADEVEELNALYTEAVQTQGTSGDDWIYDNKLNRFDENENLTATADSIITGGDGNDVIEAGKGDDRVGGGNGDDLIAGGQDEDRLYGNDGDDKMWGGSENDMLSGGRGDDVLHGGGGNDTLRGGADNDMLFGDAGNDVLAGHRGDDHLLGGAGQDSLYGNTGEDMLDGGRGHDFLRGGAGNDVLRGGAGHDQLHGGEGSDVFDIQDGDLMNWSSLSGTKDDRLDDLDVVQDFTVGEDTLSFEENSDVEDMSDLKAWKVEVDENVMFMLQIPSTNERLLVDVEEDAEWSDVMDESNFLFG